MVTKSRSVLVTLKGETAVSEIGKIAKVIQLDITNSDSINSAVKTIESGYGISDIAG